MEPEESFIDYLALQHVQYPEQGRLVINSKYTSFEVFEERALVTAEGIADYSIRVNAKKNVEKEVGHLNHTSHELSLQTNDTLDITAIVEHRTAPLYLLLGSRYRDWTLGEIPGIASRKRVASPFSIFDIVRSLGKTSKVLFVTMILSIIWFFDAAANFVKGKQESVTGEGKSNRLVTSFGKSTGVKFAHADSPGGRRGGRSLVVEYKTGDEWKIADVVQPRYYQPTLEAVEIPNEAINQSKKVSLRVTATKKHNITNAILVAPKKKLDAQVETLNVKKATSQRTKSDYASVLNKKFSGEYLHTIPADIVDVEFDTPSVSSKKEGSIKSAYVLEAWGYYANLSDEAAEVAGNWVNKLDPEARAWLKDMYALGQYSKVDRKPVLEDSHPSS